MESGIALTAMSPEDLRKVIEEPAKKEGVSLEPGLTDEILGDLLTSESGESKARHLPLLEFALDRLWDKRKQTELTLTAYRETERVEGALAAHAESTYQKILARRPRKNRAYFYTTSKAWGRYRRYQTNKYEKANRGS